LKRYVQSTSSLADTAEGHADVAAIAIEGYGDEVSLSATALKFPGQVMPAWSGRSAAHTG